LHCRDVLAQLVGKKQRQLHVALAGVGLRRGDPPASACQVEIPPVRGDRLADARARQTQKGEQGAPAVALMLGQACLPLAGHVEQLQNHVRLQKRTRCARHFHPPPPAPRGVLVE